MACTVAVESVIGEHYDKYVSRCSFNEPTFSIPVATRTRSKCQLNWSFAE